MDLIFEYFRQLSDWIHNSKVKVERLISRGHNKFGYCKMIISD